VGGRSGLAERLTIERDGTWFMAANPPIFIKPS
jgi:hypothetical protein